MKKDCADPEACPDSAAAYGVFRPQKLYVHLWKKNMSIFNWNVKLKAFGGKTGMTLARQAFRKHVTQQNGRHEVLDKGVYDCRKLGLYWSRVGEDNTKKPDLFQNVIPREEDAPVTPGESVSVSPQEEAPAAPEESIPVSPEAEAWDRSPEASKDVTAFTGMVTVSPESMERTAAMAEETAEVIPVVFTESRGLTASALVLKPETASSAAPVSAVTDRAALPAKPAEPEAPESPESPPVREDKDPVSPLRFPVTEAKTSFRPTEEDRSFFREASAARAPPKDEAKAADVFRFCSRTDWSRRAPSSSTFTA